jgi:hypothetical protein
MKRKFATVLGSAVKNFDSKEYHSVVAMSGTTIVTFKSETEPAVGSLALLECYAVGDVIPWADVEGETVKEGRAFNVLKMYTTSEAFNSAKEQAKALEGLTL